MRTVTELNEYFRKKMGIGGLNSAYEWLADKGVIEQVSAPYRITQTSQIEVQEPAYYYDGGEEELVW